MFAAKFASAFVFSLVSTISLSNTSLSPQFIKNLFVKRAGETPFSNMVTQDLDLIVQPKSIYQFRSKHGIKHVPYAENFQKIRNFKSTDLLPRSLKYAEFLAVWDTERVQHDDSNILGGNSRLIVSTYGTKLIIPIVEATEEFLSYYKAHLLQNEDYFQFQIKRDFPIFNMKIGKNYVPDYLLKTNKGLYLEHHNAPHYHEPQNQFASGVYVLAKMVKDSPDPEGRQLFHITAFRIPYGSAVYTEPGSIHDDATTQGKWRVGYTLATQYSTATVVNMDRELMDFKILD